MTALLYYSFIVLAESFSILFTKLKNIVNFNNMDALSFDNDLVQDGVIR